MKKLKVKKHHFFGHTTTSYYPSSSLGEKIRIVIAFTDQFEEEIMDHSKLAI